ncbi:MAG: VCBS repeat-containing protein [Planctomycetaceae bacterium]|nr:VCBS repeat-containing protein [Planctomycetaceae bacterium]
MKLRALRVGPAGLLLCCALSCLQADDDTSWVRIKLDERFRSEGVTAGDYNKDGVLDVAAGDVWYQAPSEGDYADAARWTMNEIRMPGEFVAGKGYSNSFANATWDMNADGWPDVVIIGFPGDPFAWYQNPGAQGGPWQEHNIWSSICNESPEFEDLNGDGTPEFVFGSQPQSQMGFVDITQSQAGFQPISEPSKEDKRRGLDNGTFKYYHGLGVDDVNGDGHEDIIIAHGWWQSPGNTASKDVWTFHPIRVDGQPLPGCANIYADDFDVDGDADLIFSSAHAYGVWWAENRGDQWVLHEIDKSFSQTHAMERADINGDGQMDYVTGKRFFAHNGNDPGGNDEVVMCWYEVQRTPGQPPVFTAHRITAGSGTGIGTQFEVRDMNGDSRPDIVLSNKKGVNVLLQK